MHGLYCGRKTAVGPSAPPIMPMEASSRSDRSARLQAAKQDEASKSVVTRDINFVKFTSGTPFVGDKGIIIHKS